MPTNWTQVTGPSTTWTPVSPPTTIWTIITGPTTAWTLVTGGIGPFQRRRLFVDHWFTEVLDDLRTEQWNFLNTEEMTGLPRTSWSQVLGP